MKTVITSADVFLFFGSDLYKYKLEKIQLKTLTYIDDEKQVGIKDAMAIISSSNAYQKLLYLIAF